MTDKEYLKILDGIPLKLKLQQLHSMFSDGELSYYTIIPLINKICKHRKLIVELNENYCRVFDTQTGTELKSFTIESLLKKYLEFLEKGE